MLTFHYLWNAMSMEALKGSASYVAQMLPWTERLAD